MVLLALVLLAKVTVGVRDMNLWMRPMTFKAPHSSAWVKKKTETHWPVWKGEPAPPKQSCPTQDCLGGTGLSLSLTAQPLFSLTFLSCQTGTSENSAAVECGSTLVSLCQSSEQGRTWTGSALAQTAHTDGIVSWIEDRVNNAINSCRTLTLLFCCETLIFASHPYGDDELTDACLHVRMHMHGCARV